MSDAPTRDELGRFPPGTSGNPSGRPKGTNALAVLERKLAEVRGEDGRTQLDEILDKMIALAKGGDRAAADLILKRTIPEKLAIAAAVLHAGGEDSLIERILAARKRAQRAERPEVRIRDYTGLRAEREARRLTAPDAPQDGDEDEARSVVVDAGFDAQSTREPAGAADPLSADEPETPVIPKGSGPQCAGSVRGLPEPASAEPRPPGRPVAALEGGKLCESDPSFERPRRTRSRARL